ncbi:MAG: FAD-binding protein [Flavobacteriaceae bacterium]|nr:FAD-binding protein [Flavobacteriaceae bacterium]
MGTALEALGKRLNGALQTDNLHRVLYATDASVYRKKPLGVCYPKDVADLKVLIDFAKEGNISLIPRTAGTSLAGQCVGEGLVVDMSKHFTAIGAVDKMAKTVVVQPGVIRDDLNRYLKDTGLFFGPNTSTSNRCMIGGMVGNNSSGTTSIKYGVTRDKIVAMDVLLSDGSEATFETVDAKGWKTKASLDNLEGAIYRFLEAKLSDAVVREEIKTQFPHEEIHRRNNGYAVDALLDFERFGGSSKTVNVAQLLSGSEGTLAITTSITLQLDAVSPAYNIMVAAHFDTVLESMEAVVTAMKHDLYTCELMDKTILDCTKDNREQRKNRFFLEGDPEAILMLEMAASDMEDARAQASALIADLKEKGLGYAYPMLERKDINKALDLRKAGLGLLGNIVGDDKAVACIEDTAVLVKDLPNYIAEFTQMMKDFGQEAVYYAHAGAGELHLRPILNLKKQQDVKLFREITHKTAKLVKKYNGCFSGEHGDGIVRAEFIPLMVGEKNYELFREIKACFDPKGIFNPGKIVDALPMDENLRFEIDRTEPEVETLLDFSDSLGILRATEKCNGSGDCRKSVGAGGTLCPSYRATKDEKDSTRARANALREFLTVSPKENKFDNKELLDVFDLCLSCKACAAECPSNVDVASLKAEFLYQYYKTNKRPFRSKLMGANAKYNALGSLVPGITNTLLNTTLAKKAVGIAVERSIPKLAKTTVFAWYKKQQDKFQVKKPIGSLQLFVDEFTNYYDAEMGIAAIELLTALGYVVHIGKHKESGRGYLSKGMLDEAKVLADYNIAYFAPLIKEEMPLVGLEPSAILSFKDEYLRLASDKEAAKTLAKYTYTIEAFLAKAFQQGNIGAEQFHTVNKTVKIHGHCHQKSLENMALVQQVLEIPQNYTATILTTGCCGMAGSFGYEKEHYAISMKIGEDSVFPKVRKLADEVVVAASGTSCRHQIYDGTKRTALHPVQILREALL